MSNNKVGVAMALVVAATLILVIINMDKYRKYSHFNTNPIKRCGITGCDTYNVHKEHHNPQEAAGLLREIIYRNNKLMEHLRKKYVDVEIHNGLDPDKNNRIDVIHGTEVYHENIVSFLNGRSDVSTNTYIQERLTQLFTNYDTENIYEISPLNTSGVTSYSENKRKLVLCLREKEKINGQNELHDINTMMFVVIHELAHMMNDKWGHDYNTNFWQLFKFLLNNAEECGVYKRDDYSKNPKIYCGLKLSYNPLYDSVM